jgi:hypothetical protein
MGKADELTMKRLKVAAAAALLSAACSGTEPGPLHVTMQLDKVSVAMDDSIRVALTVVNASTRPVMVYPSSAYGPCVFSGFELFDSGWRQAHEGYFCLATTTLFVYVRPDPVALAPGESMHITRWWKPAHTLLDGQQISPGHYRIRGAAVTPDATIHTSVRDIIVGG